MKLVVKIGSALLSKKSGGLDRAAVRRIAKQLAKAHRAGHKIVVVSSGAIAAGAGRLGLKTRPKDLHAKQAAAAVGQSALMKAYDDAFSKDRITPAQMLLTREDLNNRQRYLNAKHTLLHLLSLRVIPIINENDSVSTEEIKFGDNDTLSAIVAKKISADKLVLLSDVPGLLEQNPDGTLTRWVIANVRKVTSQMQKKALRTKGSQMSVGGIVTKLSAAKLATAAGIETWIASGTNENAISQILAGRAGLGGTRFQAQPAKRRVG